jgi:hypothetical protein
MYHVVLQRAPFGLNSSTSDIIVRIDDVIIIVGVRVVFYRFSGLWWLD